MNSSKSTSALLDVRIILAGLWIAFMLSSLQGDSYRLHDLVAPQSNLAETAPVAATQELLLVMSIIFVVPVFMSFLTLILKYPVVRWLNLASGLFFAVFQLVFLALALFVWHSRGYEIVWSIAYCVCAVLIVWYAWKWPTPAA